MHVVRTYSIVVDPDDTSGYTVTVPSLPGCVTRGETVDECLENARRRSNSISAPSRLLGTPFPKSTSTRNSCR